MTTSPTPSQGTAPEAAAAQVEQPTGLSEPASYEAPMPTPRTVRLRTNVAVQAWRFATVSVRMTRMILRSHG